MFFSPRHLRQMHLLVLSSVVLTFSSTDKAFADAPLESEIMPKASKSLLIDVDKVGDKIVVVGERGHILISNDQGQTWVQSQVPTAQMLNAVDFVTESTGWAVGHDGNILFTQDGGETWVTQRDGLKSQHESNINSVSAAKAKIKDIERQIEEASVALPSEISAAVPSGLSADSNEEEPLTLEEQLDEARFELESAQEKLEGPAIAPPLMDVWFADEKNGWVVGAFGTLLKTMDGGKTWENHSQDLQNTDGYHLNAIVGLAGTVFIAGESGFLVTSQDNGVTWVRGNLGYEGTIFGLFASADSGFVIATGLRGNTLRTLDAGRSWQPLNAGIKYSLSSGCAYSSSNVILVGTGGSIAISNDSGNSFKQYTLPARASLSGVVALDEGQFLLVGQGGVHHFDIKPVTE